MSQTPDELLSKIKNLEEQIASLRLGRRILMNLIIEMERSKNQEIASLKKEIKELKRHFNKCH